MQIPSFDAFDDPGPSFVGLLDHRGLLNDPPPGPVGDAGPVPHGTTVLAVRHRDGVVMAGDRRATAGNLIRHSTVEKVFAADRWSGVAIAGAAGPAVEMVRLFQLQLEHYEKVEGSSLSLEGKANQLSQMIRNHLPAAMQGLAVVPLFAGWDRKRRTGRLFQYDVTGGRYEELDHATSGSGGLHAGTVLRLGFREGLGRGEAIDLTLRALMTAAEADSATGGPDPRRGIWPIVAEIAEDGFTAVEEAELADRHSQILTEEDGS